MDCLSRQLISIEDLSPTTETTGLFCNRSNRCNIRLLVETAVVTIVAVSAIKILQTNPALGTEWFVMPCILVAATIIPTLIKKSKLSEIGLSLAQMKYSFVVFGRCSLVVFPAIFCGLWLLKSYGFNLPLRPVLPQGQELVSWIFYQFMYVAVAEELFFRGYLQGNIMRLTGALMVKRPKLQCWATIVISAACFAIAHVIVQGQIISALTFAPGLIFGWLFIRTRSLLAPILFHGLANTCYYVMAELLTA